MRHRHDDPLRTQHLPAPHLPETDEEQRGRGESQADDHPGSGREVQGQAWGVYGRLQYPRQGQVSEG